MTTLSPARIMEVGMAFWPAKVLLSAVETGVFTVLGSRSMTAQDLQKELRLHQRANPDFFDTLVALHFLARDGVGSEALYRNTDETAQFLDQNSSQYMGGFLEMANTRLYRFWGDLTEALRTGKPQNEIKHSGAPMFDELYSEPERLEQFMDAMSGISVGNFQALAQKMDWLGQRQNTLAQNIANADTPDYVPRDMKHGAFERLFARSLAPVAPRVTDPKHMVGGAPAERPSQRQEQRERFETAPSGNAVVLEEQLVKVAETQMDYQTMTNLNDIYYSCDTKDKEIKAEKDYLDDSEPTVKEWNIAVMRKLLAHPQAEALDKYYGENFR